jgi:hypothetical protein
VPLGAMVISERIADWVRDKYFAGGLTYSGHPLACAAGVASIEAFREEGIVENAAALGEVLGEELPALADKHSSIGEVRGLGLFWALELVKDRETREPLDRPRARALPDDPLERRHGLPAVDDHARGARRGPERPRRGTCRRQSGLRFEDRPSGNDGWAKGGGTCTSASERCY